MTDPDGPPADAGQDEPSAGGPAYDPLLPRARVTAGPRRPPRPTITDGDLGGWFHEVEQRGPSQAEALRRQDELREERSAGRASARQTTSSRIQVHLLAALGAAMAAFAPGHPTGLELWDAVLRMAFAYVVVLACAHARRWTWIVLAGAAAAGTRDLGPVLMAWSALALSLAAAVFDFRRRRVGAVVGLLAVNALLRLAPLGPHGLTAGLTAAVVAPVLISAYRVQRRAVQRRVLRTVWALGGLTAVAVAGLGIAGLFGAGHVSTGQEAASAGLELAKSGKQDESALQFSIANDEFGTAEGVLDGWFVQPSRLVPFVGYQTDALATMSAIGHELTATAERVTTQADYRRIRSVDGRIDVDEITAWGPPLAEVETALVAADAKTDQIETAWLASPILDRFRDLDEQVSSALDETRVARQAVAVAPSLLGAEGVRRYFIAFTTPAETRGLGGFMGNWAILEADDGRLELTRHGRSGALARRATDPERVLEAPADYLRRYGSLDPASQFRDITLSPDFPSVAEAISSVYPQTLDGTTIDGALAMDPYAIAAMLEITGPIQVEGLDVELSADNAADYLLREQYLKFDPAEENAERKDVLEAASTATFDAFISQPTFRPSQLAAVLGPVVSERRLVGFSADPDEEALVTRLGLDGAFPAETDGDFFSLVTQNAGNNKIDIYLHRSIDYDVVVDPRSGTLQATATVTLHNDAPSTGLPAYVIGNRKSSGQPDGANWLWFNFYTPHLLTAATMDGQPLSVGEQSEFGRRVYQAYLAVPSGGDAVIELTLEGSIAAGSTYDLGWYQQPVVNTDEVRVTVRSADRSAGADSLSEPVTVTRDERTDQHLAVPLPPST